MEMQALKGRRDATPIDVIARLVFGEVGSTYTFFMLGGFSRGTLSRLSVSLSLSNSLAVNSLSVVFPLPDCPRGNCTRLGARMCVCVSAAWEKASGKPTRGA